MTYWPTGPLPVCKWTTRQIRETPRPERSWTTWPTSPTENKEG